LLKAASYVTDNKWVRERRLLMPFMKAGKRDYKREL
jgi:hypothetical protein